MLSAQQPRSRSDLATRQRCTSFLPATEVQGDTDADALLNLQLWENSFGVKKIEIEISKF